MHLESYSAIFGLECLQHLGPSGLGVANCILAQKTAPTTLGTQITIFVAVECLIPSYYSFFYIVLSFIFVAYFVPHDI